MTSDLLTTLQTAQDELEPQYKALRNATTALKRVIKLASEEKPEALAMQKALVKLQQVNEAYEDEHLQKATAAFASVTQKALDALAFEFARDLKAALEAKGHTVSGRPPTLGVEPLALSIDPVARKAQWLYGKDALTRSLSLSLSTIMKAHERQHKAIAERATDKQEFITELYKTWKELLDKRARRPAGNRINIIETYSQMVMNRQSSRFWRTPSRQTFRDYDRAHFIRDLALISRSPLVTIENKRYRMRLGVATKSQANSPSRSIWLPESALDGQFYSDITFEEV